MVYYIGGTLVADLGRRSTSLDGSVFFSSDTDSQYNCGYGVRYKCVGGNENGIFEVSGDFWPREKRMVIGIAMSHFDGLMKIAGPDEFIEFPTEQLRNMPDVEFFEGDESI